jgi:hypothetical protein
MESPPLEMSLSPRPANRWIFLLLAVALGTLAGGLFTEVRGQSSAQAVQWVNLVNTSAIGGTLQKTAGEWDAGANSQQQIGAAGGYVEFTVSMNHRMQVGLSNDTSAAVDYTQLKYTFNLWGTYFDIREGWSNAYGWWPYQPGDVFRIAVEGDVVRYYRNGVLLRESTRTPSYPLVLDTALSAMGATVQNAVISNGSRAVILDGSAGSGGTASLPSSAPYNAVGDFEIAFRMRDARVNHTSTQHVFTLNNHYWIAIGAGGDWLFVADSTGTGQNAYVSVSTHTYFKIRHIQATGVTTLEAWDADGGNYEIRRSGPGSTAARDVSGPLGFGRSPFSWDTNSQLQAKVDWLRWKSTVGPEGVQPSDFNTDYDLLRWDFEGDGLDSSPNARHLSFGAAPGYGNSPATSRIRPIARLGPDQTVKPGALVTLDASTSASSEGNPTYSWEQIGGAPVTLSSTTTVNPTFTAPTPSGDSDCHVFRLTVTDAGGTSTNDVYIGVVKTGANDEVVISDPKVRLLIGPQLMHGSPLVPHPKFDEIELRRGREHGERFPNIAPHIIDGTVSATNGSRVVTGVGTRFTQEIEMDPLVAANYRGRLRIADAGGTKREVEVESIQSDTQLTLKAAWSHASVSNAAADTFTDSDNSGALQTWWNYYDTAYTMYIEYYRTGNTRYLKLARKIADVWWSSDRYNYGGFVPGPLSPNPRNKAMAGLILRALDGKPKYWDGIQRRVYDDFQNWVLTRITRSQPQQLYYDIREDGYAQLYAVMLSHVLPDSYTQYPNGTNNAPGEPFDGASRRQWYRTHTDETARDFFGRAQQEDGSWLWDIGEPIEWVQVMQPFMVGIYLEAAILQHQITTDQATKDSLRDQIVKACTHLKDIWRTEAVPGMTGVTWRGHWYFYHGGTPANPNQCANGCSPSGEPDTVPGVRHLNSEVQHAFGYAYVLTGDPAFKTHGDDMLEADFGGTDGFYGQADTAEKPKDYNMNYRAAGRYLAWRLAAPKQSIALDGGDDRGVVNLPNAAPFNGLGDFEIAFRMRNARVNHTAYQDVFTNDVMSIRIASNTDWLAATEWSTGGASPFINIGTRTYFRVRHVRATGVTTLEGWDADGSNYAFSSMGGGTTGTINFAGDLGFGRAPWSWPSHNGPLQAKIDWLRWRSSVGPTGVRPLDGDTDYDLLRWELEGVGQDSSTRGLHLTLYGSPGFENTP